MHWVPKVPSLSEKKKHLPKFSNQGVHAEMITLWASNHHMQGSYQWCQCLDMSSLSSWIDAFKHPGSRVTIIMTTMKTVWMTIVLTAFGDIQELWHSIWQFWQFAKNLANCDNFYNFYKFYNLFAKYYNYSVQFISLQLFLTR